MEDGLQVLVTETGHIDNRFLEGKEVRPGCLGQLSGPIADWSEGTRNGRMYSRDLWVKVFDTPWVQEALETKSLFGEADHPDERLESKISCAAVVMTDYEFVDEQSTLYGWFDILDTPSGRILRTLAEYGTKLGVSSRGRGKIITRGGKQVVEESSYLFGGFDIVALPAVKKARQDFVAEGLELDNLYNSIEEQINECQTTSELSIIRNVLESSEIKGLDNYISLIEARSNELGSSSDAIVEKLTNDLQMSYSELNRVKKSRSRSRSRIDAINEDNELMERENIKILTDLVDENSKLKSELVLKDQLINSNDENLEEEVNLINGRLEELTEENKELIKENRSLNKLKSRYDTLEESNKSLKTKVRQLSLDLKSEDELNTELTNQYNELVDVANSAFEDYEKALESYLELRCNQSSDLSPEQAHRLLPETYTIEDIDRVVRDQENLRRRMSKLPISVGGEYVAESYKDRSDTSKDRYKDLTRILSSMKSKT